MIDRPYSPPRFKVGDRVRFVGDEHTSSWARETLRGWVGEVTSASDAFGFLDARTGERRVTFRPECFVPARPDEPWGCPGDPEEPWSRERWRRDGLIRLEGIVRQVRFGERSALSFLDALRRARAYLEELDRHYSAQREALPRETGR